MNRKERESLIALFQHHVNQVSNLQFGNYVLATSLCSKTKMLADRYFPERTYYFYDLIDINFKPTTTEVHAARLAWDDAYSRLLAVANSMLDEVQLDEIHKGGSVTKLLWKRVVFSGAFFLISSYILWSFNAWVKWAWLTNHPKQIAIYLSFQFTLFFISLLFFTDNRQIRTFEWFGVVVSVSVSVASMIVSAVA